TSKAYRGPAMAASYSGDLHCEGRPVVRQDDSTLHNRGPASFNTRGVGVGGEEAWAALRDEHGRIPERFCGHLAGNTRTSKRLIDALPETTRWLNEKLAERGYTI